MEFVSGRLKAPQSIFSKSVTPGLLIIAILVIGSISTKSKLVVSGAKNQTDSNLANQLSQETSYVSIATKAKKPVIYAKEYVLLDATSAEVIVSEGADDSVPIASTTKMTTALVTVSKMSLDQVVTISSKPPLIQGSKMGLLSGEKITVRSLLQGLLIHSGNDAAFALAEHYAQEPGNYQTFVKAMNEFATNNHLSQTVFGDPAGLDDAVGRSTPRELANIARMLLNQPFLAETVATANLTVSSVDGQTIHQLKNTNRLILSDSSYYLPNAIGVKTGFTLDAGHSLVAAYKWHDRVLIGVVMNTTESTITASAQEMNKLFRWADSSLEITQY